MNTQARRVKAQRSIKIILILKTKPSMKIIEDTHKKR